MGILTAKGAESAKGFLNKTSCLLPASGFPPESPLQDELILRHSAAKSGVSFSYLDNFSNSSFVMDILTAKGAENAKGFGNKTSCLLQAFGFAPESPLQDELILRHSAAKSGVSFSYLDNFSNSSFVMGILTAKGAESAKLLWGRCMSHFFKNDSFRIHSFLLKHGVYFAC